MVEGRFSAKLAMKSCDSKVNPCSNNENVFLPNPTSSEHGEIVNYAEKCSELELSSYPQGSKKRVFHDTRNK